MSALPQKALCVVSWLVAGLLSAASGCASATPREDEAAQTTTPTATTTEPATPREGETCFTPEVSRRGGDAPAPPLAPEAAEAPGDEHGCAPFPHVADTCCCSAVAGPRFDGARCCYVIEPCGCC